MAKKQLKKKAPVRKFPKTKATEAKPTKERKDPRVQEIYEEEIQFMCPTRGLVKQKVKVKRFKSFGEIAEKSVIYGSDQIDKLEEKDDGLAIYSDGEEITDIEE